MENTLYSKMLAKVLGTAVHVNFCAREKDINRNHVNYGSLTAYTNIISELGHKVDVAVWEDNGVLKIPKITIDGNVTEFADGK